MVLTPEVVSLSTKIVAIITEYENKRICLFAFTIYVGIIDMMLGFKEIADDS